jgi:hypothetical protein
MGPTLLDQPQRLAPVACLTDDLDPRLGSQQRPQPLSGSGAIVGY